MGAGLGMRDRGDRRESEVIWMEEEWMRGRDWEEGKRQRITTTPTTQMDTQFKNSLFMKYGSFGCER
jgi:hypothetical protein